ncbi:MAG TPA: SDR family oxidoreductase [Thermoanaerobaculia bacterium]|nr:SDR family oxidoreductase [Thermoanaerobaculia bacterium]
MTARVKGAASARRVALVTGGAVRLGRAIALERARAGCDVAIHYHASRKEADAVAAEARAGGVRATVIRADLSRPADCSRLVGRTISAFGRLDLLVGSAANFLKVPFSDTGAEIWDAAIDLNARANFLLARAAEKELRSRRGRVVLISDLAARRVWKGYSAHAISKAAVEAVVRVLARQLAPEVSVNGVAPGTILPPTNMPKAAVAKLVSEIPLRRCGTPEEIAAAVAFFCDGPGFVTGEVLTVDGGRSLY